SLQSVTSGRSSVTILSHFPSLIPDARSRLLFNSHRMSNPGNQSPRYIAYGNLTWTHH
ncbi:hypothetical protein CDAR_430491, partial [Caerostris darwini]